jgi:hypothetical protein
MQGQSWLMDLISNYYKQILTKFIKVMAALLSSLLVSDAEFNVNHTHGHHQGRVGWSVAFINHASRVPV